MENLAFRQQLAMMNRRSKRIHPTRGDRFFWIAFVRIIEGWRKLLVALHPDTVVRWHRDGWFSTVLGRGQGHEPDPLTGR